MSTLTPQEREALYRECSTAITDAGRDRESLFLARLALLLIEAVGDATRCRAAITEAARDLPAPGMTR